MHSKADVPDRIDLWSDRTQTMVQTIKTVIRPNWPLIIPNPDHGPDYKDCDQTELTSDQTKPRPWSRLKRLWSDRPDRIELWSDRNQTMVQTIVRSNRFPDPVISVWEHRGVRSIGSDHSSIWVWTKTWDVKTQLQ